MQAAVQHAPAEVDICDVRGAAQGAAHGSSFSCWAYVEHSAAMPVRRWLGNRRRLRPAVPTFVCSRPPLLCSTRSCCLAGGILLTVSTGPNARSLFLMLIIAQTIFGFGVSCSCAVHPCVTCLRCRACGLPLLYCLLPPVRPVLKDVLQCCVLAFSTMILHVAPSPCRLVVSSLLRRPLPVSGQRAAPSCKSCGAKPWSLCSACR